MVGEDIEARLQGQRRWMGRREVSTRASVSLLSARKLWQALGFPTVRDEDMAPRGPSGGPTRPGAAA